MKKPLGIRAYLFVSQAVLLVTSLGAIGFIWSRNEYQTLTDELQKVLLERAGLVANVVGHEISEHGQEAIKSVDISRSQLGDDMHGVYIDETGFPHELIIGTVDADEMALFQELAPTYYTINESITAVVDSHARITNVFAAAPVYDSNDNKIGIVCLLMPIEYLDRYITRLRLILAGAIAIVVLLGAGGSTILTNYFSRQFIRAESMAATIASGDYHLRIPEQGPDELRNLSKSLNHLAEKLQDQLKERQTLLANVAHELARPLAGLELGIESLRKGALQEDPGLADDLLVSMRQTISRFEALIDDITLAAYPQSKPIELNREALSIEPILRGAITRYWTVARSRDINFEVHVEPDLPELSADDKRLNQILGNLMDNAIKFSAQGKTIRLSAEKVEDHKIRIQIHDGGAGVSPDDYERIFEPFYQGDTGRRIKQGMGLGLAIAQQLARAHGGELELKNHPNGGGLAILTLPFLNS